MTDQLQPEDIPNDVDTEKMERAEKWLNGVIALGKKVADLTQEELGDFKVLSGLDVEVEELNEAIEDMPDIAFYYEGVGYFSELIIGGFAQLHGNISPTKGVAVEVELEEPSEYIHTKWEDYLRNYFGFSDDVIKSAILQPRFHELKSRLADPANSLRLFVNFMFKQEFEGNIALTDTAYTDNLRMHHKIDASTLVGHVVIIEKYIDLDTIEHESEFPKLVHDAAQEFQDLLESDDFLNLDAQRQQDAIEVTLEQFNKDMPLGVFRADFYPKHVLVANSPYKNGFTEVDLVDSACMPLCLANMRFASPAQHGLEETGGSITSPAEVEGLCIVGNKISYCDEIEADVVWVPLGQHGLVMDFIAPSYRNKVAL